MRARSHDYLGYLRFLMRRWAEDRIPQIAGSLTYTTLLALVPLLVIAISVMSTAPIFEDFLRQLRIFLRLSLVPDVAERVISVYMVDIAANAQRLTVAGIGVVMVVSVWMMLTIDRSLNAIWRTRRSRPTWLSALGYLLLLVAGPILIGISVSVTTYIMTVSFSTGSVPRELHRPMLRTIATLMSVITFFLIYIVIPHRRVPWRHALIGAVIAALLFEASKEAFAAYVRIAPTYHLVYGTAAFVPVFLIWVYTSWLVILLGAEITASAAYWRDDLWKKTATPVSQFRQAVILVRALAAEGSEPAKFESLRKATSIPAHELEDALERLSDAKIVARVRRRGYTLARAPQDITLADIYEATLPPGGAMSEEGWEEISPVLARSVHEMRERLECPVMSSEALSARAEPLKKGRRGKARSGRSSR